MMGAMPAQRQTAMPKGCATLIAVVVMLVAIAVVGVFVNSAQRAEWEAQSGTSLVAL